MLEICIRNEKFFIGIFEEEDILNRGTLKTNLHVYKILIKNFSF